MWIGNMEGGQKMCDELGDVREVQKGSLAPDFVPDLMPPRYPESISVKWKENEAN